MGLAIPLDLSGPEKASSGMDPSAAPRSREAPCRLDRGEPGNSENVLRRRLLLFPDGGRLGCRHVGSLEDLRLSAATWPVECDCKPRNKAERPSGVLCSTTTNVSVRVDTGEKEPSSATRIGRGSGVEPLITGSGGEEVEEEVKYSLYGCWWTEESQLSLDERVELGSASDDAREKVEYSVCGFSCGDACRLAVENSEDDEKGDARPLNDLFCK